MLLKEQVLELKRKNPSFGYRKIAGLLGCTHNTVRFHIDDSYRQNITSNRRANRQANKQRLVKLFGSKCCRCGYNKCLRALEFHHTDPSVKEKELNAARSYSFETMLEEAKKCILVCSNCHAEIHEEIAAIVQK